MKYIFTQKKLNLHEALVVADALNRKAQHTVNTVVITQLNFLRGLEDLHVQLVPHWKENVQLLSLISQPFLMEEPRVNQNSDPTLQRIKQNLKKADLKGGS